MLPSWRTWLICVCLPLAGCADGDYAQIYVRALDPASGALIPARVLLEPDGQVLYPGITPLEVNIRRSSYWYPGKLVTIVVDAPGHMAVAHKFLLSKWGRTVLEATLNANNVDVWLPIEETLEPGSDQPIRRSSP